MIADPWIIYGYQEVMLSTTKETHSFSFAMTEPTNSNARIAFDVGASDVDVYLDDICMTKEMTAVDPELESALLPGSLKLFQNYPNPFNAVTMIIYQLQKPAMVNVSIYNIKGQLVETLVNESQEVGLHEIQWHADGFETGLYFYQIKAGVFLEARKCLFLK